MPRLPSIPHPLVALMFVCVGIPSLASEGVSKINHARTDTNGLASGCGNVLRYNNGDAALVSKTGGGALVLDAGGNICQSATCP